MHIKKQFYLSFFLFLFCIILSNSSCSNEHDELNHPDSQILFELEKFNESLEYPKVESRISGLNWVCVAASDACGAYSGSFMGRTVGALFGPGGSGVGGVLGAVIGGAGTSRRVYLMARNMETYSLPMIPDPGFEPPVEEVTERLIISRTLIKAEDYDLGLNTGMDSSSIEIGIQHNYILDLLQQELDDEYNKELSLLQPTEQSIVTSEAFENGYDDVLESASKLEFEINSKADSIMRLFLNAVNRDNVNFTMAKFITTNYVRQVQNSNELTNIEKTSLINAFGVFIYSFEYWSTNEQP